MPAFRGGVDEAGRGCVAGPLVVAGVSVSQAGRRELVAMGVKDSKKLSPRKRERLYPEIRRVAERVALRAIPPAEIDRVVLAGQKYRKLNHLEAVYFASVIDELGAQKVTVDAADSVPRRFRSVIMENLKVSCSVSSVHKADRDDVVVGAASIVAKVHRDWAVGELRAMHGDFGSGYPSDPSTRSFFASVLRRGEPLPDYVRKSWKTWETLDVFQPAP
jgi:ribonuclease HII